MASPGHDLAEALSRKDFDRAGEILHPEVDFRALTPNRQWEASTSADFVSDVLHQWFEPGDVIEELESVEEASVSDREHIAYRFNGHNDDGPFVVEQQAYYTATDGRIDWLRILCSGFRPRAES